MPLRRLALSPLKPYRKGFRRCSGSSTVSEDLNLLKPVNSTYRPPPDQMKRIADALDRIAILLATINKDLKELVKTRSSGA
jgi:hypothetical protein